MHNPISIYSIPSNEPMLYFYFLALFFLSTILSYAYISYARHRNWLDIPNQRSSHIHNTPRGGGVVFISIWLLAAIAALTADFLPWRQMLGLVLGSLIVSTVAFYDDRKSLSARSRGIAYVIAAIISVLAMGGFFGLRIGQDWYLPLGWFGPIFAVLVIVWSINLFNFMDGIDGIVGIEALFVLGMGGLFLWLGGGYQLAILSWLLVATVAGFLVWNFPPAKLFMGDVGSTTLGFVISTLALTGEKYIGVPAILWFILYGVFIFDATFTFLRRLLAKERWYEAHRLHAYQRLHQAGWSHRQIVWAMMGLNILLGILAVICFYRQNFLIYGLLAAFLLLLLVYLRIERYKPMY